ncbi:MAG TPA: NAD(P)H-binding protein [Burkholderiaceae bacterium]|nr:NAD(P)H-binding protein [Burkholderiaceae bacterium]
MKLIVFGPTGGTGQQLVAQGLAAGHEVTAFTRRPEAIAPRLGLTTMAGDTRDPRAVERAIAGRDVVLCALGGSPLRRRQHVCATAMANIVPAMVRLGVRRVLAISTQGAGDTRQRVSWLVRHVMLGFVLRSEVADKEAMEAQLSASPLEWTVVRVSLLTDEAPRGRWRVADDGSIRGMGKVARADVASFMLAQIGSTQWLRRCPVIAS